MEIQSSQPMVVDICRLAFTELTTSCKIQCDLDLSVSPRTVRRHLSSSNNMRFMKFKSKLPRLEFARKTMGSREFWRTVVFSDEKKFNLDGPGGIHHYWQDLRKKPFILSKRVQGSGSVMIWITFGYFGQSKIVFVNGRMNSKNIRVCLKIIYYQLETKLVLGHGYINRITHQFIGQQRQ